MEISTTMNSSLEPTSENHEIEQGDIIIEHISLNRKTRYKPLPIEIENSTKNMYMDKDRDRNVPIIKRPAIDEQTAIRHQQMLVYPRPEDAIPKAAAAKNRTLNRKRRADTEIGENGRPNKIMHDSGSHQRNIRGGNPVHLAKLEQQRKEAK